MSKKRVIIERPVYVRFEGLDAEHHFLDAGSFSETLAGINKIASSSMHLITYWEMPVRKQPVPPFRIMVSPPQRGSFGCEIVVAGSAILLPLVAEVMLKHGSKSLWALFSSIFLLNSNKEAEMDPHFKLLMEVHREDLRARGIREDRLIDLVGELALHNQTSSARAVNGVGRGSAEMAIGCERGETRIDGADASIIREKEEDVVGGLEDFVCEEVDGLIWHNRRLRLVLRDDEPGHITAAEVRDPAFEEKDNIYIKSYNDKSPIIISAKPVIRDGKVIRLIVMDANPLNDSSP